MNVRDKCATNGCRAEAEFFYYFPGSGRLVLACRFCAQRTREFGLGVGLRFRPMPLYPGVEPLPDLPRRCALPIVAIETTRTPPAIEPDAGKLSEADGLTDEERRTLLEGL